MAVETAPEQHPFDPAPVFGPGRATAAYWAIITEQRLAEQVASYAGEAPESLIDRFQQAKRVRRQYSDYADVQAAFADM
jgi:hypothetical protein